MGKKLEREWKVGAVFFPKTAYECFSEALEDLELTGGEDSAACVCKSDRRFMRKLPVAYIRSKGQIFRVRDVDGERLLDINLHDGAPVSFTTPKVQRGKNRWAYDVKPVPVPQKKREVEE